MDILGLFGNGIEQLGGKHFDASQPRRPRTHILS
jgi:hypothetical protein